MNRTYYIKTSTPAYLADCCDNGIFDDYPLYVAGVQEKDNFNAFHNFYAIFSCNFVP